jgi:hypothetical protein
LGYLYIKFTIFIFKKYKDFYWVEAERLWK